mgnify:CR=1 FL=1
MAFPKPTNFSIKLRLYNGASFKKPIEGIYSYSPCQLWKNQNEGFPRIPLKDMEYISNNLNAAPKITEVSIKEIIQFWKRIKDITNKMGCVEGVSFKYSKK